LFGARFTLNACERRGTGSGRREPVPSVWEDKGTRTFSMIFIGKVAKNLFELLLRLCDGALSLIYFELGKVPRKAGPVKRRN